MSGDSAFVLRDLASGDETLMAEAAQLLVHHFGGLPGGYHDLATALAEVRESLEPGRVSRVAVEDAAAGPRLIGWIGGIPRYPEAWELHPLVVDPAHQGRGVGRALVADLEREVARRGGRVLYVGTDDARGETALARIPLGPGVLRAAAAVTDLGRHPAAFYRRLGFEVVGILPDANGPGRPDIFMAKRLAAPPPPG